MNLTIESLSKSYSNHIILKNISLTIESGSFVSLLGPSGSGKTTLLRCIAGLEQPDSASGKIQIGNQIVSNAHQFIPPQNRNLGMVFQNYAVWPHLNVLENVAFPLRIASLKRKTTETEILRKAQAALSKVRLVEMGHRFAHELSGGQQQRVALARALAMNPDLLLLDEPLSNLDALLREELGTEIRRLQKELGLTTLLVTHDQKEALSLSDQILILKDGQMDCVGTPESLYTHPPTEFAAQFLAAGQILIFSGAPRTYLPRRWSTEGTTAEFRCRVTARLFLGNEYEYWGTHPQTQESVRFFSSRRIEMGQSIGLNYEESRKRGGL